MFSGPDLPRLTLLHPDSLTRWRQWNERMVAILLRYSTKTWCRFWFPSLNFTSCLGCCHATDVTSPPLWRQPHLDVSFHSSALTPTGSTGAALPACLRCIYLPLQRCQCKWSPSPSLSFSALHYHPSVSFYICIARVSSDRSVEMVSRQEQPTVSPMTNTDLIQRLAKCGRDRQISAITHFTVDRKKSLHASAEYIEDFTNWFSE